MRFIFEGNKKRLEEREKKGESTNETRSGDESKDEVAGLGETDTPKIVIEVEIYRTKTGKSGKVGFGTSTKKSGLPVFHGIDGDGPTGIERKNGDHWLTILGKNETNVY